MNKGPSFVLDWEENCFGEVISEIVVTYSGTVCTDARCMREIHGWKEMLHFLYDDLFTRHMNYFYIKYNHKRVLIRFPEEDYSLTHDDIKNILMEIDPEKFI